MPFTHPPASRFFEDYVPGDVHELGPMTMSEAEIIEFARRFDPQYIHVEREAAERGPYHGLIASGWHTASATMRVLVDEFLPRGASLGSPGIDQLRWKLPVRPGDELRVRVTINESIPSRSKPDRGVVKSLIEVLNASGQVVMSLDALNLFLRRPAA